MSFSKNFDIFRDKPRVVVNDLYMGDEGAHQLAIFLAKHTRVQSLEIKSNNITGAGFISIFGALQKNPNIKQIIAQYNDLGKNDYEQWHEALNSLLLRSSKLERLNLSNNKINSEGFNRIMYPLCESKSLKLLQIRYNSINSEELSRFVNELNNAHNTSLLYVEAAGNKISRQIIQSLQLFLKDNRKNSPISKQKLLMACGLSDNKTIEPSRSQNNFNRISAIDDLSKEGVVQHLETILDHNRRDSAQVKVRLQNQLVELQHKQKVDSRQLNQLETRCNQVIIQNRNLKFELDRTVSEHQQMQRDQQSHLRMHEDKLRDANKQLQELENKYEELESRMNKQHELKIKETARDWENRLRSVEEKVRTTQNQNSTLENQIRKHLQKRQRLRIQIVEEDNIVRSRIQQEETQRYNFKLIALESRLQEVQETREQYIHRNQDILFELEKCGSQNNKQISILQEELGGLKLKQEQFVIKNKDFVSRNQRIKNEIQMKQISVAKLEEEINKFNDQIQLKKTQNRQQIDKIILDNDYDRSRRQEEKEAQIHRMTELQSLLRKSQMENSKLRQQYALLAQKLQISLGRAVQDVFSENNLN